MSDYIPNKFTLGRSQGTPVGSPYGRNSKTKGDRTRRSWSDREEANLLLGLRELVTHGWKSDNGFRAGYLSKLEESLKREFPSTDLKGTPHINSKITAWKKSYNVLTTILDRSGVGFGYNGDFKIDCDDEQWAQIVKLDRNARGMRNKAWPYLEQWKEIFGKDRANGAGAEDVMDAVNSLYSRHKLDTSIGSQNYNVSLDDLSATEPPFEQSAPNEVDESSPQSTKSTKAAVSDKSSGKKRKHDDSLDELVVLLSKMHEDTNARLECLSMRIGYEFDLTKVGQGYCILEKP